MADENEKIRAWHFIGKDRKLSYGDDRIVEVGKTLSVEGEVRPGWSVFDKVNGIFNKVNGMHASTSLAETINSSPNDATVLCMVEVFGDISKYDRDDSIICGRHRTALEIHDVEKELYKFACNIVLKEFLRNLNVFNDHRLTDEQINRLKDDIESTVESSLEISRMPEQSIRVNPGRTDEFILGGKKEIINSFGIKAREAMDKLYDFSDSMRYLAFSARLASSVANGDSMKAARDSSVFRTDRKKFEELAISIIASKFSLKIDND